MPINDALIEPYCSRFFGYGDLRSKLWFIGMEEGGGRDLALIGKRLEIWQAAGRPRSMDAAAFHRELGDGAEFFRDQGAPIQPTWNKLIEAALVASGQDSTCREARREFQARHLGRCRAEHALLELLPLPAPGHKREQWIYGEICGRTPWLADRPSYTRRWLMKRECALSTLIAKQRPRVVVMYGKKYEGSWDRIAQGCLRAHHTPALRTGSADGVTYFALPHPRHSTLEQWHAVGRLARRRLSSDVRAVRETCR